MESIGFVSEAEVPDHQERAVDVVRARKRYHTSPQTKALRNPPPASTFTKGGVRICRNYQYRYRVYISLSSSLSSSSSGTSLYLALRCCGSLLSFCLRAHSARGIEGGRCCRKNSKSLAGGRRNMGSLRYGVAAVFYTWFQCCWKMYNDRILPKPQKNDT